MSRRTEMLAGVLLYILPILLFIASISSLELYDDSAEEIEGKTAAPALLSRSMDSGGLNQFLLYGFKKKEREDKPIFVRANPMLVLFNQSMKDLEYKVKYLEKLYAKNKDKMADGHVSEVVVYISQSYKNLTAEYKKFKQQSPQSIHPVKMMRAYSKVRMTNLVATKLLEMFNGGQFFDKKNRLPPLGDTSDKIAWAYYDDSLG